MEPLRKHGWSILLAVCTLSAACVGSIGGGDEEKKDTPPTTTTDTPLVCDPSAPTYGPSPLRRLSRTELRNTLKDLFPGVTLPDVELPADSLVDGFDNNEAAQTATPVLVEQWSTGANAIGRAIKQSCAGDVAACADAFVKDFGPRVYRRPLDGDEIARFTAFVVEQSKTNGYDGAISMLIEALLQSPSFLYKPEGADLSGYEIATRVSYLLWQTMPDATLFDAAKKGELSTKEGVETHARRMLADPRAKPAIADFHRQWLSLDSIGTMSRDRTLFPAFTDQTPGLLRDATSKYVDHVFWDGKGTLESLLTEPKAYVNDTLAPLYGVAKPGPELTLVDLDPKKRAGILTHAGFLADKAHEKFDSPIKRGVFVLGRFMCAPPPPPPPNVKDIPESGPTDAPKTTRMRVEEGHALGGCKGCHDRIDGVGFLFDHYDAVGAWRDQENGLPIDATGGISELGDMDGSYDGAVSLSQAMGKSGRVRECFSRQWFRFAYGRTETSKDGCAVQAMVKALEGSGGNMKEMIVQLVVSDAFRKGGAQ